MQKRPATSRSAMRGWMLAVCSAALTVAAHGMAGGGTPDTAIAILLTGLVAWAGTSVADRLDGTSAVLTALGSAQVAMHLILNYVVPSQWAHTGHIGDAVPPFSPVAMLLTHAVATVVTGVLIARADAAVGLVSSAMRLLLDLVRPRPFPAVPVAVHTLPPSVPPSDHIRRIVLRRVHARRGPPHCS